MRLFRVPHLIFLFGAAIALPGCFQSDSSPTSTSGDTDVDEESIRAVLSGDESEITDPDILVFDNDLDGAAGAPIATEAWRRELLSLDKTVTIVIHRPPDGLATADVAIAAEAVGLLHLLVSEGDVLRRVRKDFSDSGQRRMYFERRPTDVSRHRGWHLVALSGVVLESPGTTRSIRSVRLQARGVDETFQDVTGLVPVVDLLELLPMTEVRVTVDTGDATDHVFLHRRHLHRRMELTSLGDGTFTGVYVTGRHRGPRHLAIDVLSHGTLYDDEAPYDNIVWGIPYRVDANTGWTP